VFKRLIVAALLSAPSLVLAGQAMSLDEGLAAVSTVEDDAVMAPMQDGGGASSPREADAARRVDEIDVHSAAPRAVNSRGTDATTTHSHKGGHGRAPWQALLPGVMK